MNNKVAEYRRKRNLTQRELASLVGITVQAISNIEAAGATPRAATRATLARVLDVSEPSLFPRKKAAA